MYVYYEYFISINVFCFFLNIFNTLINNINTDRDTRYIIYIFSHLY